MLINRINIKFWNEFEERKDYNSKTVFGLTIRLCLASMVTAKNAWSLRI